MRVLAGSGPAGLAGMASVSGALVRPLLPFRHAELLQHLEERGLTAWSDPANSDSRHLRSWIRTDLLPTIRARLPDVDAKLQCTARQASRDRAAWNALLDQLPGLDLRLEYEGISVAAPVLAGYDSSLVQAVICAIARRAGCRLGPARLTRVLELLSSGSSGDRVPLGGHWTAELTFGRLRLGRNGAQEPADSWSLAGNTGRGAWGRWRFRWELGTVPDEQTRSGLRAWFTPSPITVRSWVPGEKLKPLGGTGRRLIVRCFQDQRVPSGLRGSWPVLAEGEEVMWVPGVCRSDARVPSPGTEALRVDAEYA
jgi:tRNA(Ile)-lysidine synthase